MDISHHCALREDMEYYEEEELVEEINSDDEYSEYTLMSFAEDDLLSTILEETSIDLWTKGSSMSMPGLDDLDSICSMESLDLDQQDTIQSQQESCNEEDIDDFLNDSLGHMEISDNAEEDTQLQESVVHSRLSGSQTSRATLSTASLSRTSSSLSSFAASPSTERTTSISNLRNAEWDQVTDATEQRRLSLVGIDIQFFRSIEYGSISPTAEQEDPSKCSDEEEDSSSLEAQGEPKSNKSKKKKKKNNKKSKKDTKEKCDKKTDKKSKKDVREKLKSKKTKNKKDKSKRKKLDVDKDSKQSKKHSKELDSSNVTKTRREMLREKIRTRIESIDKKLRAVREI